MIDPLGPDAYDEQVDPPPPRRVDGPGSRRGGPSADWRRLVGAAGGLDDEIFPDAPRPPAGRPPGGWPPGGRPPAGGPPNYPPPFPVTPPSVSSGFPGSGGLLGATPVEPEWGAPPPVAPVPAARPSGPPLERPRRSAHGSSSSSGRSHADRRLRIGARHNSREQRAAAGRGAGATAGGRSATPGRAALGAVTEVVVVLAMALILSLLIKTFLVQAFFIPSASMETTLLTGDRVLVSKLTPGPFALHHGDIVVFKDPGGWLPESVPPDDGPARKLMRQTLTFVGLLPQDSGEHLIKRVIGLPGDTVKCCDAQGRVSVNGVGIDETPYLFAGDQPSVKEFVVTVPADHLWVMGDHRSVSQDSRYHPDINGGFVPIDDVVGKAFVVVWPLDRAGGLSVPSSVFARVPERD